MKLVFNVVFTGFLPYLLTILSIGVIAGLLLWRKQRNRLSNLLNEQADKRNGTVEKEAFFTTPFLKFTIRNFPIHIRPLTGCRSMYTTITVFNIPECPKLFIRHSIVGKKLVVKCDDDLFASNVVNPSIEDKLLSFKYNFFNLLIDNCKMTIMFQEPLFTPLNSDDYDLIIEIINELLTRIENNITIAH